MTKDISRVVGKGIEDAMANAGTIAESYISVTTWFDESGKQHWSISMPEMQSDLVSAGLVQVLQIAMQGQVMRNYFPGGVV